jgi:hypothetical protein
MMRRMLLGIRDRAENANAIPLQAAR